jgi:D-sedoheptulose 7-phosphate isomerase
MNTSYFTSYYNSVGMAVGNLSLSSIMRATAILKNCANFHQRVWIVGNGGSAATAMHFANDLEKMCGIDALALPGSIPTITAYGNDNGWSRMFADAMRSFQVGDVLVAISCSGSSQNVVESAKTAIEKDGKLIVLTGKVWEGNLLAKLPGIIIPVENEDIKVVEDVHLVICHSISGAINAMSSLQSRMSQS